MVGSLLLVWMEEFEGGTWRSSSPAADGLPRVHP